MNNKLSDFFKKEHELTEEQIEQIIFTGIENDGISKYAIVFGNPDYLEYRIHEAIKLYKDKKVKKLILTGGIGKETIEKQGESEAFQMKKIALENGVLEKDIILEDKSTTTIENCINVKEILNDELNSLESITLVSSRWHLKRCLAIALKYLSPDLNYYFAYPKDNITDKENWKSSKKGKNLIIKELSILTRHAYQKIIYDLELTTKDN